MENTSGPEQLQLNNFPSAPSLYYPNSNSSEATSMPPAYTNPAEYPPTYGMPYLQQYPTQAAAMSYPQPYVVPPPGGQPYYITQPGGAYPGPPGVNYLQAQQPQHQQQQHHQVVVVNNQPAITPFYVVNQTPVSMVGAIVLSCFAFWCFGMVFGGIAFILAMVGQSSAAAGDTATAIRMRNASTGVSIAGIIIAIILFAIIGGLAR